jgi:hypothetical protein
MWVPQPRAGQIALTRQPSMPDRTSEVTPVRLPGQLARKRDRHAPDAD